MGEPFLAEVRMFAGNFAPRGWAFCHGQLMPIAKNHALFSLLGTMYGGDGRKTFGLPDLRGRAPIGAHGRTLAPGKKGSASVAKDAASKPDDAVEVLPHLAVNFIIAIQGTFPSRS